MFDLVEKHNLSVGTKIRTNADGPGIHGIMVEGIVGKIESDTIYLYNNKVSGSGPREFRKNNYGYKYSWYISRDNNVCKFIVAGNKIVENLINIIEKND